MVIQVQFPVFQVQKYWLCVILGKSFNLSKPQFSNIVALSIFFFLWGAGLGFEFRALGFAKHLSHTSSPFCCGYFGDGVM
jgi:hypothetical protein